MVNYNEHKKIYEFCAVKISYTRNGEQIVEYTNVPSTYDYLQTTYGVSNFATSTVVPTPEQMKRLEDLNKLPNKESIAGFINYVGDFIEYGYVNVKAPDVMLPLLEKYKKESTEYLFNEYVRLLSSYKKDKAYGSIKFEDMVVETSLEAQGTLNGIFASFTAGLTESIEFKAMNGWFTLDKAKFMKMAQAVSGHVQMAFTAERMVKEELKKKNYDELCLVSPAYLPKGVNTSNVEPINRLRRLYEREYTKLVSPANVVDNVMEEPKIPGVFPGVDDNGKPLTPGVAEKK